MSLTPIETLLPHEAPMLLLDEALAADADSARTAATPTPDHPFATAQGIPVHVGIELMAQTCGVWAGAQAMLEDGPVRLGYLLGTRRFTARTDWFGLGQRLEISARLVFRDQGMGVFDCRIEDAAGEVLAEAQLSVYQPDAEEEGRS